MIQIALGGDSAGGNMTCVITQRLRDTKGPRLALNVPLFPETALPFDTLAGRCACWQKVLARLDCCPDSS